MNQYISEEPISSIKKEDLEMTSERERQATWEPTTENDVLPVTGVTQEEPTDAEGRDEMRGDLRAWGIGLIVLGVAQYFLPFLDSMWAFVIVPLGILSLLVAHRGLFIAIGAALVIVGLLNIFGGGFGFWTIFGGVQIYWGVQECRKFEKYAHVNS